MMGLPPLLLLLRPEFDFLSSIPLLVMLKPTTFPEVDFLSSTSLWLMSSSSSSSSQWSVKMCLPKSRGLENATEQIEQGNFPSSSDIFETFFPLQFFCI